MRYLNPRGYIPKLTAIDISWAERKIKGDLLVKVEHIEVVGRMANVLFS